MIEEKCLWYKAGVDQRNTELARGEDKMGTIGWERKGCYECKGVDSERDCYLTNSMLEEESE